MSVGDGGGDCDGSAIVAYEATWKEKTNVLVFRMKMCLAK